MNWWSSYHDHTSVQLRCINSARPIRSEKASDRHCMGRHAQWSWTCYYVSILHINGGNYMAKTWWTIPICQLSWLTSWGLVTSRLRNVFNSQNVFIFLHFCLLCQLLCFILSGGTMPLPCDIDALCWRLKALGAPKVAKLQNK